MGRKEGWSVEDVLLTARSITRAQRMDAELQQRGITAELIRAPASLSEKGCAYALRLRQEKLNAALAVLKNTGLMPYQIFVRSGSEVREVLP